MEENTSAEILALAEELLVRELRTLMKRSKISERVEDLDGKGGSSTKILDHTTGINALRMLIKDYKSQVLQKPAEQEVGNGLSLEQLYDD